MRRTLFRIVHARGSIPNEVGPARCGATPAFISQTTRPATRNKETRKRQNGAPFWRFLPGACRRPVLVGGGGGGGVYLESYTCEARFLTRWDHHAAGVESPSLYEWMTLIS